MNVNNNHFHFSRIASLVIPSISIVAGNAGTETYRGKYVSGHEVRTFQICGNDKVYWVRAGKEISNRLKSTHQKLTTRPYEHIYGEIEGKLTGKAGRDLRRNTTDKL